MPAQHAFLWVPVGLVAGVFGYFAMPIEPPLGVFAALLMLALSLAIWARHRVLGLAAITVLAGVLLAKARTEYVRTPVIVAASGEVAVSGSIDEITRKGKRATLTLSEIAIAGMAAGDTPRRLRLTVYPKDQDLQAGQEVRLAARLYPLPTPVSPGAYDFGRALWFEGIGATGRATGAVTIAGAQWRLDSWLDALRTAIGRRIAAVLDGAVAAFAEAIISGERGTMPKEVNQSLQISGLAHILSISGLHMSLVAGGVFWLVRALAAAVPALALRYPIKKWAAVAALMAGLFYMLLAGSGVATQRSYIMLAVMFIAVLFDRPAISMRNLAIAAIIVLALQPEASLSASFQMSFMAVMGLIAFHEAWSHWRRQSVERRQARGRLMQFAGWSLWALAAMIVTSLAAGLFSSIPAAYHFGRLAPLSLLANLLALPVVSVVVMPMALLAVIVMPLGLEYWPLWLMGEGLELVLAISDWVAGLPGARTVVAAQPALAVALLASGAIWLCLWRGRWRFAGLGAAALGLAGGFLAQPSDILIERTAGNVAYRDQAGQLAFADRRRGRFAGEKWLIANGEDAAWRDAVQRPGWACAGGICRAAVKGKVVAYANRGAAMTGQCSGIDILIAAEPLRGACRQVPLRIDRFDVWRRGAYALWLGDDGVTFATARQSQGERPWTVTVRPRLAVWRPPRFAANAGRE